MYPLQCRLCSGIAIEKKTFIFIGFLFFIFIWFYLYCASLVEV